MSGNPDDPDLSGGPVTIPGPVTASNAAETTTASIPGTVGRLGETNKGAAVESVKGRASDIANGGRRLAQNLAIVQDAAKSWQEAKAEWEKASIGARKADLDAADEQVRLAKQRDSEAAWAVSSAQRAVNAAQADIDAQEKDSEAWYTAMRGWLDATEWLKNATAAKKDAEEALKKAERHAADLKARNKSANEALRRAFQRIAEKMKGLDRTVLPGVHTKDGGTGRGTGRPGTVNMPGYREPYRPPAGGAGTARGSGAGVPKGGKEMPSMPSTPAKPSETGSTGSGKVDPQSLLTAAALMNQQGQQQPQAAAAAPQATPTATAPQTQPQEKKDGEKKGKEALDSSDIDRLIKGEDIGRVLLGQEGVPQLISNYMPGPSSPNPHATQFRPAGTPITGTAGGGTPLSNATAQQVTSGSSVTGMNTRADVTGSSTPAATAYDSPKTNTSAAHGTATEQQQNQQAQRTAGAPVGGAPVVGGGAPGAAPAPRTRDKEDMVTKGSAGDGGLDHGQTSVSEAVRGGTIAQNRPDTTGGKAA